MWNVSESTIKRWTESFGLRCFRTAGGHRRFRLEDLSEFQQRHAFEATGVLSSEPWEHPELEEWLNSRSYGMIRDLLFELACFNRRPRVRRVLERLYLRGLGLEEIYDFVLVPLEEMVRGRLRSGEITRGQALLIQNNIEDALFFLAPKLIRRQGNGRMALCASPCPHVRVHVALISWLLEVEGWEPVILGDQVPFDQITKMVEIEPVDLVCIFVGSHGGEVPAEGARELSEATRRLRIPLIVASGSEPRVPWADLEPETIHRSFRSLRKHLGELRL
ncbi:MAG: hypothetical protein Kow00109_10550 [Acidobacteriota bacterium]